jgi:hypothetical protein
MYKLTSSFLFFFVILFISSEQAHCWQCSNSITIPTFASGLNGATIPLLIQIISQTSETLPATKTTSGYYTNMIGMPPFSLSTFTGFKCDNFVFSCPTGYSLVGPSNWNSNTPFPICGNNQVCPGSPSKIPTGAEYWPTNPILPTGCAPKAGGQGDPQLMGFQGQSYQFHGIPDEVFNIISTPELQVNGKFTYISNGNCNYNHTLCWTHPGTYIDEFGIMIKDSNMTYEHKLRVKSQKHTLGLYAVIDNLDNEEDFTKINVLDTIELHTFKINHPDKNTLEIDVPLFNIRIINSDEFFNFDVSLKNHHILHAGKHKTILTNKNNLNDNSMNYPSLSIHGLVGQTWKNIVYCDGRLFEGEVDDYLVSNSNNILALFGTHFHFNMY